MGVFRPSRRLPTRGSGGWQRSHRVWLPPGRSSGEGRLGSRSYRPTLDKENGGASRVFARKRSVDILPKPRGFGAGLSEPQTDHHRMVRRRRRGIPSRNKGTRRHINFVAARRVARGSDVHHVEPLAKAKGGGSRGSASRRLINTVVEGSGARNTGYRHRRSNTYGAGSPAEGSIARGEGFRGGLSGAYCPGSRALVEGDGARGTGSLFGLAGLNVLSDGGGVGGHATDEMWFVAPSTGYTGRGSGCKVTRRSGGWHRPALDEPGTRSCENNNVSPCNAGSGHVERAVPPLTCQLPARKIPEWRPFGFPPELCEAP